MKTARSSDCRNFYCMNAHLINECWLIKKETKEMGRKNGSVFRQLWRLLWDSGGATGAEPCDVTVCRASDKWTLTRAIDKSKSQCLNFKDSAFFFFPCFQEGCCQTAVWCKADWYITGSLWGSEGDKRTIQPTLWSPVFTVSHAKCLVAPTQPPTSLQCWWVISHLWGAHEESYLHCIDKQALPDFPMVPEGKFPLSICKTNLDFSF